jgi:hypothetical protein
MNRWPRVSDLGRISIWNDPCREGSFFTLNRRVARQPRILLASAEMAIFLNTRPTSRERPMGSDSRCRVLSFLAFVEHIGVGLVPRTPNFRGVLNA